MSAMNTIAIVDGFSNTVVADEMRIKARLVQLIRTTVEASAEVSIPQGTGSNRYAQLAGSFPTTNFVMETDINASLDERLSEAAELLFESYD